ncbi:MAG: acyltransferase family protein [Lachnotalea sp.]
MKEKRLSYLEGLRGLAAIMVFLCHFGYAFYNALYSTKLSQAHLPGNLDVLIAVSPLNVLYNGKVAVRIFFLLCGYVICIKFFQTGEKKYLVNGAIKRYFRLVVPIFVIEFITYLLMKIGAYHNSVAATIANSFGWFGTFNNTFEPSFLGMLKEAFYTSFFAQAKQYNNLLWIIKYEFIGSLIVYLLLYITGKWKYRDVLYVLLIILCIRNDYVCIFIGMLMCDVMQNQAVWIAKLCRNKFVLLMSIIFGIFLATYPALGVNLEHTLYRFLGVPRVIIFYDIGTALLFWALLNISRLQKIMNARSLNFLGKYSFGIYLVHFPIIATFSSWFLVELNDILDYNVIMLIDFVLTVPMVLFFAILFTKYIEPLGERLANFMADKIMVRYLEVKRMK